MHIIQQQLLFYIALTIILFLPGYFLLLAIFGRSEEKISRLERFVFSFGLSLVIVNFIAFAFSKINISITASSSILGVAVFCLICFGIYKYCHSRENGNPVANQKVSTLDSRIRENDKSTDLFNFSKKQFFLIFILLFLTIFIKIAYLTDAVAPTSTDMGHHLYWTKEMVETNRLPIYDEMPDFIIGEHIALAEIAMISGLDFFGAGPVIFLLLINILGILTVFVLTLRIFGNKTIAIFTLLFLGFLFAIASPQTKFVSGGVFGNILGNFLMPMCLYFYFRAFESLNNIPNKILRFAQDDKNSQRFLSLAIFVTFGLFYTHHLTAFIFLFVFVLLIPLFLALNYKNVKEIFQRLAKIFFSLPVLAIFIFGLLFFFFIFTPNYVQTSAVGTAVGAPSKATREGLTLPEVKNSVGEARLALGIIGLLILSLSYRKKDFGFALIFSWAVMIFLMSTKPSLIFINLPSSRIGNYLTYPLSILSAYGLYFIFNPHFFDTKKIIPQKFLRAVFLIIFIFVLVDGLSDSASAFKKSSDQSSLLKTFDASRFLKEKINKTDVILKDHNYITGDSWIKLFFMQGYRYPASRGYFKRYEDPTKPREMCTLYMISNPAGDEAKKCFEETKTNILMVNPHYDSSQFQKLKNFDEAYDNGEVSIYYKQ